MKKAFILCSSLLVLFFGCAHKKVAEPVTLKNLQSKRVALGEIKGAKEQRAHVEVGLLNEIAEMGRFEIVDRTTVEEALTSYPTESDWQGLGKKVGADYVLGVKIVDFKAKERKGFDKVTEEDSVLTEESGSSKPVVGTRYAKVKSYEGTVMLACKFFDVNEGKVTLENTGTSTSTINSRDYDHGAMPGKMALLEKLSGIAIRNFFENIPKN